MRFMLLFRKGEGDYTKERRRLFKDVDAAELLAATKRRAKRPAAKRARRRSA
jgi:hypothetical protein